MQLAARKESTPMEKEHQIPFFDVEKPVSMTDATGLIPAALEDDDQADAYEELYPIHRQKPI